MTRSEAAEEKVFLPRTERYGREECPIEQRHHPPIVCFHSLLFLLPPVLSTSRRWANASTLPVLVSQCVGTATSRRSGRVTRQTLAVRVAEGRRVEVKPGLDTPSNSTKKVCNSFPHCWQILASPGRVHASLPCY